MRLALNNFLGDGFRAGKERLGADGIKRTATWESGT